jgi:hypothetical protein
MATNPNTGKTYYYKDNVEAVRKRDANRMYVNGKEVSKKHPLHKPGRYKTLDDAWSHVEIDQRSTEGEVYIITNKAFPNWYKVGKAVNAEDRLNGYQTSSPFRDYELRYSAKFDNRHKAETDVHRLLRNVLSESHCQGEWFNADYEVIKDMIDVIHSQEKQLDLLSEAC